MWATEGEKNVITISFLLKIIDRNSAEEKL